MADRVLIIGGTRNLGPSIVRKFLGARYAVTVLNRGLTSGELPQEVERLRADRSDPVQLQSALAKREFDVVVDTTLYNAADARTTVQALTGRTGRYIFISTGQVYLLREGLRRPYRESDYAGPVIPAPSKQQQFDYENWLYGFDKRDAEDVLSEAWREAKFPFVTLRLPMVNSERDHFERIQGYVARLLDGGPILLPDGDHLDLRHVYGEDVAVAILKAAAADNVLGRPFNISQDDKLTIDEFLSLVAESAGTGLNIMRVPLDALESRGLYPDCSPFSEPWMSELDNAESKRVLGMTYTPYRGYVPKIVEAYLSRETGSASPVGYAKRPAELELVDRLARGGVTGKRSTIN